MFRSTSIVATALLVAVSIGQGDAFSSPASLLGLRCSNGAPQGRGGGKEEAGIRVGGDGASAASLGRRAFLLGAGLVAGSAPASAADGLFGAQVGWGEKKAAGIKWDGGFANPLGSQPDDFLFEVVNGNGTPVVLSFQKPKKWKVSTNAGITIQDYISADSGFILVAPLPEGKSDIAGVDPSYMLDKVFDIRGRYGTYGKVDSMTVTLEKTVEEGGRKYKYIDFKFTTLSPGSREIDRNGCIKVAAVDGDMVMLIASSNANRWKKQKEVIASTITTFSAAPAPKVTGTRSQHTLSTLYIFCGSTRVSRPRL